MTVLNINKICRTILLTSAVFSVAAIGTAMTTPEASAASCWNHNGSEMRITATGGGGRSIRYLRPKSSLRSTGVRRGTLLFNGHYDGHSYTGTARRFSRFCVGSPQTYQVGGPANAQRIVLSGNRDKNRRCQHTGRNVWDTLVFTFIRAC